MSKPFAWSFSALDSYETCPKRHYHLKVAKDVVEKQSDEILWGNKVHDALEKRLKDGTPLPPSMAGYERMVVQVERLSGTLLAESKLAITEDFKPTTFFAKNVWCRAIVDAGKIGTRNALLIDWKTGNPKVKSDQLMLSALVGFAHHPELETVASSYVWLKVRKLDKELFSREQVPILWQKLLPRVHRLEQALKTGDFPPKPSGLCRRWCPVRQCKHHGE